MWVVIIHPVLETGHYQVISLLAQINLLSENGNFFERKLMMSLVGVYLRLNVATSKIEKKEFSCAKKEKKRKECLSMTK
jgi:hypothetical protein